VRWEQLFADLEGQLDAAEQHELVAEVADRTRREAALIRLVDRLLAADRVELRLRVQGAGVLRGVVDSIGADWLLLATGSGPPTLVRLAAVTSVVGLGPGAVGAGAGRLIGRLGLGSALRAVARDRARVTASLVDGTTLTGVLERVGADYVELAEQQEARTARARATEVVHVVPFAALAAIRLS
jgi:hypothetical protein